MDYQDFYALHGDDLFDSFAFVEAAERYFRGHRQPQYPGFEQHPLIHPTSSKTAQLEYAHYTDDRFKRAQLVYLGCSPDELKSLSWDYSDRIYQWDYQKANDAAAIASKSHQSRTAAWAEAFVAHCYDDKVELKAIATGFNLSDGYDYFVYGYTTKEE